MPAPANLVHQQSTSTGTGNLTLSAVNGKQSFATAFGSGGTNVFDYFVSNQGAAEWERGTGHITSGALVRDTVSESTNANAAVNFSAGTKDVVCDIPAANQVFNENSTTTAGFGVLMDGTTGRKIKAAAGAPLITVKIQTFAASGTYTPSTGMLYCIIECQAGGGGGGGAISAASSTLNGAGGGGAGEYSKVTAAAATIGASQTVTIGAAGTAGASGNNSGGNGGTTSVGAICTAGGGTGGGGASASGNGNGGAGGSGGTGSYKVGDPGFTGYAGSNSTQPAGERGASSPMGSGGQAVINAAGNAGSGFGSGGSGGSSFSGLSGNAGGAGTGGKVIITEFCSQ